jgi:hypothetical protein
MDERKIDNNANETSKQKTDHTHLEAHKKKKKIVRIYSVLGHAGLRF